MNKFKKIDNIKEYLTEELSSRRIIPMEYAKFTRITARRGTVGEKVVTVMANGLRETDNTVKPDAVTGNAGWIVKNITGEEYIIEDSVFTKKYELVEGDVYKPKGEPVIAVEISEDISFVAPWGELSTLLAGGYVVLSSGDDFYGIQKDEFAVTYKATGRDSGDCLAVAKEMLGIK